MLGGERRERAGYQGVGCGCCVCSSVVLEGGGRGSRMIPIGTSGWRRRGEREEGWIEREEVGLGLEGGAAGPWAGLALGQKGCGEAALFSLSLLYFLSRKQLKRRKGKRGLGKRICAWRQFSRTHKNELDPGKIEVGMTKRFKFKFI